MDTEKIQLLLTSIEANIKLLKLEIESKQEIKQEQPNNTISLRELIGKMHEETDDYEPDYVEEP